MNEPDREGGVVKMFDDDKGFGFIKCNDGDDLFVHASQLPRSTGIQRLVKGQKVSFVKGEGRKGLEAKDVYLVLG